MTAGLVAVAGDNPAVGIRPGRALKDPRVAAIGCILLTLPVLAQGQGRGGGQVVVTTRIVMASNTGGSNLNGADDEWLRQTMRMFPFKSYRLVQHEVRRVKMSGMEEFPVPGERHLLVQPTAYESGRVSLDVMLMEGRKILVNTALKLRDGGEFVVAGPRHGDGVLFLVIGASRPKKRGRSRGGVLLREVESR